MSDDFLARESELLGDEFSIPTNTGGSFATATGGEEIDFDAAASAFPDISLDGDVSIPEPVAPPAAAPNRGFSFDDFEPPRERTTEVKVTGDDEIEKFESEFPEIDLPSVSGVQSPHRRLCSWCIYYIGAAHIHLTTHSAKLWRNTSLRSSPATLSIRVYSHLEPASGGGGT